MVKLGFLDKERERKRVKPFFFMTYYMDIILRHIFPKNFIKVLQVPWKILWKKFS